MKRLISLLLTVCLLAGLLPAATVFAAELEKPGIRIKYDLSKVIFDNKLSNNGGEANSIAGMDYEMTGGLFSFVPGGDGHYSTATGGLFYISNANDGGYIRLGGDGKLSLEIEVPEAGIYDLEMYNRMVDSQNAQNNTSNKDTVVNVYISRDGISTAEADFKGSYSCYEEGKSWELVTTPNVIPGIEFPEAGKYTITFTTTCVKWVYNTVGTFILNGEKPKPELPKSEIKVLYDISEVTTAEYAKNSGMKLTALNYDTSNGFFAFKSNNGENGHYDGVTSAVLTFKQAGDGTKAFGIGIANEAKVAFDITVPKAGKYNFNMYNLVSNDVNIKDTYVNIYLSKDGISTEGEDFVGKYTCYDENVTTTSKVTTPNSFPVEFEEEGTYTVTFTTNSPRWFYSYISSFELDGGDGLAVMKTSLETKTGKAALTAVMSDCSELSAEELKEMGAEITYTSSKPEVAAVDASTGEISDIASGKTEISANVLIDGKTYTAESEYTSLVFDSGVGIYYDLTDAMLSADVTTDAVNLGKDPGVEAITYDITGGMFRVIDSSIKKNTSGRMGYSNYAEGSTITLADGQHLAFEVYVPRAGIYNLEAYHGANDQGLDVDVFLSREKSSKAPSDLVGTYSCYTKDVVYGVSYFSDIVDEPSVISGIRINEPGYYVFTFQATDGIEGNTNWIYGNVGSFRLVSGYEAVFAGIASGDTEEDDRLVFISTDKNIIEYTDVENKDVAKLSVTLENRDGEVLDEAPDSISYRTSSRAIATIGKNGVVTPQGDGNVTITTNAVIGGVPYSAELYLTVIDATGLKDTKLEIRDRVYVRDIIKPQLKITMNSGNVIIVPQSEVQTSFSADGVFTSDGEMIRAIGEGNVTVSATSSWRNLDISAEKLVNVQLHEGKNEPTYYTYERRENAKRNIERYDWAASTKKTTVEKADDQLSQLEAIYDMIVPEGLPRSLRPAAPNDPDWQQCRFCAADIVGKYGDWTVNPFTRKWKLQCPDCKRLFPSNDFESFYKLGLDEAGYFDRERALEAHAALFGDPNAPVGSDAYYGYGVKGGHLTNELYKDLEGVETLNVGKGLRPGERTETWGVDDGWGYIPKDEKGNPYLADEKNDILERHCYIATYNKRVWDVINPAIQTFADAYLYTDDVKYGRAGAILLDRVADVYPSFDIQKYHNKGDYLWWLSCGGSGYGKIQGNITDNTYATTYATLCDAFFPVLFEDSGVVTYLSEKAEKFGLENKKSTSAEIWENWEKGILSENFINAQDKRIAGNFGLVQTTVAATAVVLDKEPESTQMIDWIFKTGGEDAATNTVTGGNMLATMIDIVDRDGMGGEVSDNYNIMWTQGVGNVAQYLLFYKGEVDYNLYNHPKFGEMLVGYDRKLLTNSKTANVGDGRDTAALGFNGTMNFYNTAFVGMKDTVYAKRLAQYIYTRYGFDFKSRDDVRTSIFDEDPEAIENEILELASDNPEQKSDIMAGYGLAVLRDGGNFNSDNAATSKNTLRDFWLYYGLSSGHGHGDTLNLGLDAYGLDLSPDLGYPALTGTDAERLQWTSQPISHNTVVVQGIDRKTNDPAGDTLHFDDTETVKLMDVEAPSVYPDAENFRRTVVMIKANDEVSYGIDFFRVTGGTNHTYSFHAQAEDAYALDGLEMTEQKDEQGNWIGSYVGVNVPYTAEDGSTQYFTGPGRDPYTKDLWSYNTCFPRGYSWLSKVRRDKEPEQIFAVEFDIKDYRKAVRDSDGIRLRMTQLNDFTANEVAITAGPIPNKVGNKMMPETFDYVLVQREGENLDSLFTTVYEPYKGNRYIEKIEAVDMVADGGTPDGDKVRALKVTHTSGRCDYIVYSSDNTITYTVTDNTLETPFEFSFRGFVGVLSRNENGNVIYRYVCDGDIIESPTEQATAYEGIVTAFDKTYGFGDYENWIDIKPTVEIDPEALSGKYIYIENDGAESGIYKIEAAKNNGDGTIRLDIGTITLVRSFADPNNFDAGYVYNIEEEQSFKIPISFEDASLPVFDKIPESLTTSVGSSITVTVNAESPIEDSAPTITYIGTTLPRGASLNSSTGTVTWKPASSQIGKNHVAVTARDSDGRENTIHFTITVYGSTTGGTTQKPQETEPSEPSGNTGSAGGGGGGGATTPTTPNTDIETPKDDNVDVIPPDTGANEGENIRFIDLENHIWAEESINSLADEGIVKGTSVNTYSPENNIIRADFAILLVRAFEKTSDNTDNFDDVQSTDYFARELAIARNTGIVSGIGNNKFAPRNYIKRCDMMLMLYRVLMEQEAFAGLEDFGTPEYADFDTVPDYAKEAVSALIGAGLVNGKSDRIAPNDNATRAEVAVLIKRLLDFVRK